MTNTITTNVSKNSDDIKVKHKMDYIIFCTKIFTCDITIHNRYYLLSLQKISQNLKKSIAVLNI